MTAIAGDVRAQRVAGGSAVVAGALLLVASPLYVVAGRPPSLGDEAAFAAWLADSSTVAITTKVVDGVYVVAFLVFLSALRPVLCGGAGRVGWLGSDAWVGDLVFGSGLVHAAVVLMGDVLAGAAALDAAGTADPTAVRALTEGSLLAFGALGFLLTALFLAALASAALVAGLPRVIGWFGWVLAVLNLVAVPTVYRGNDFLNTVVAGGSASAGLWSYASSAAGGLYCIWLVWLGVVIWRHPPHALSGGSHALSGDS